MLKSEKLLVVFIFLFWLIRLLFINQVPIFGDEANHLMLADLWLNKATTINTFVYGGIFPGLIVTLSGLRLIFTNLVNPLFIGRAFSFGCTAMTTCWLFKVVEKLFNKEVAYFSAFIYLLFPMNLFHGQLVMLEPLMTMLFVLSLYFCLKLIDNFWWIIAVGVSLYLATATKLLVLVSLPALLVLPLLVFPKRKRIKSLLLVIATVVVVTAVIYPLIYSSSNHFLVDYLSGGGKMFLVNLKLNSWRTYFWVSAYYSWIMLVVTLGVFVIGLKEKSVKIMWLFGWMACIILLDSVIGGKFFYPRHLFPVSVPLAVFGGISFWKLWQIERVGKLMVAAILLVLSFRAIPYFTNSSQARLVAEDRHQFYEDWVSGVGLDRLSVDLKLMIQKDEKTQIYLGDEALLTWALPNVFGVDPNHLTTIKGYFGGPAMNLEKQIQRGESFYLVLNREPYLPLGFSAELVKFYPKRSGRNLVLYQLLDNR